MHYYRGAERCRWVSYLNSDATEARSGGLKLFLKNPICLFHTSLLIEKVVLYRQLLEYIRLLSKLHLVAKIAIFGVFIAKFFDPMFP